MVKTHNMVALSVASLLFLTACSSTQRMTGFQTFKPAALKLSGNQGGLVFYRDADMGNNQAVNVSLDREYLASLLPGVSTQVSVCAQPVAVTADYTKADARYSRKMAGIGSAVNVKAGEVTYVKVSTASGQPMLTPVDAQTARMDLAKLNKNPHTLPRVSNKPHCGKPQIAEYQLDASALFRYNRYAASDILPAGQRDIMSLLKNIRTKNTRVRKIVVTGYTDPVGGVMYNRHLSERRARTVANILAQNGIAANKISAQGLGETDLVVTDCDKRFAYRSKSQKQCNQPNRRIHIALFGTK